MRTCRGFVSYEIYYANNIQTKIPTVLLKLSGEALWGNKDLAFGRSVDRIAEEIKELVAADVQVAVVIGGGNLFRGEGLAKAGMAESLAIMGMR